MKSNYNVGGKFIVEHIRDGKVIDTFEAGNIVVNEGLNYILDSALSAGTQKTVFYIGVFKNSYTPIAADVQSSATPASNFYNAAKAGEITTEYSEATRQTWTEAGVSSQTLTNTASPASFTFTESVNVYGAFLVCGTSADVKGSYGTGQLLIAAAKFEAVREMIFNDILNVVYTISASDA